MNGRTGSTPAFFVGRRLRRKDLGRGSSQRPCRGELSERVYLVVDGIDGRSITWSSRTRTGSRGWGRTKRRGPPSHGWRTILHNHAPDIAAMDLFVVPTIGFDLLYAFVIVRLDRRELVWINVTAHPTDEWVARQITEAFPWNEAPRYLIRDRDRIYGSVVKRRLRAMGTRDKPIAPASPWQNSFADG